MAGAVLRACQNALVVTRCPFGALCVLDRSRCGAVLSVADSQRSWPRDLLSSLEGPSMKDVVKILVESSEVLA